MLTQVSLRSAALLVVMAFGLTACAAVPQSPYAGADPADPSATVSVSSYDPVMGGYESRRPIEPGPWGGQTQPIVPEE